MSSTDKSTEAVFDWVTLEEDEEVVWQGKPHFYSLIPAFVIGAIFSLFVIGLVIIAWAWVDRENTAYVITNKAVYKKRGAISRSVKRVSFEKIQNTSFQQGIIGTHFDYGTVEISTAGSEGAELQFRAVEAPQTVQERLNRRLKQVTSEMDSSEEPIAPDEADVLVEILEELRLIRAALETSDAS